MYKRQLQDGKIDAAFVVAGAPTVAITTLATSKDAYLVSLDDEHIAALQETSPYYSKYVIPEGTYAVSYTHLDVYKRQC